MTEQTIIFLVFSALFLIGLFQLIFPSKAVDFAVKFYSKFGMKINRKQLIWHNSTMRLMGCLYLICTSVLFYTVLQAG